MSKLARALTLAAMLAAMNLAAMTAVAQAHATDPPSGQADATLRRPLAQERFSIAQRNARPVGRRRRPPAAAGPGALLQHLGRTATPPPRRLAEPSGQAGWLTPALGVLAGVLALVAGVAVMAARRAHRTQRAGQTA